MNEEVLKVVWRLADALPQKSRRWRIDKHHHDFSPPL